jgi:hypothetical protein
MPGYRKAAYVLYGLAVLCIIIANAAHYRNVAITNNCLRTSHGIVDCSFVTDDADSRWGPIIWGFGLAAVVSVSAGTTILVASRKRLKAYSKAISLLIIAVPLLIIAAQLLDKLMYHLPYWNNYRDWLINKLGFDMAILVLPGLSIAAATAAVVYGCMWYLEATRAEPKIGHGN